MTRFAEIHAPHAPPITSVPLMMRRVLYALLPAAICHIWYFGAGLAINFCAAALTGMAAEAVALKLRGQPVARSLAASH